MGRRRRAEWFVVRVNTNVRKAIGVSEHWHKEGVGVTLKLRRKHKNEYEEVNERGEKDGDG